MQENAKILKIITVSIVIFIVLLASAMIINFVKLAKANAREKMLIEKLAQQEAVYEANENEITTKSSKEYIIRYNRRYLNMKGEGETAFTGEE